MKPRQKAAIGLAVSGAISLGLGFVRMFTEIDPTWIPLVLKVLGFVFPLLGIVVNFPA